METRDFCVVGSLLYSKQWWVHSRCSINTLWINEWVFPWMSPHLRLLWALVSVVWRSAQAAWFLPLPSLPRSQCGQPLARTLSFQQLCLAKSASSFLSPGIMQIASFFSNTLPIMIRAIFLTMSLPCSQCLRAPILQKCETHNPRLSKMTLGGTWVWCKRASNRESDSFFNSFSSSDYPFSGHSI